MSYIEVSGNIFNSKADAIVNTVNCVGVMGKGIALEFRMRYPKMFAEYKQVCRMKKLKPGQIFSYFEGNFWILNFAIKDDWRYPSKIEWIENCLREFPKVYHNIGIKSVAFPWMGAMNGCISIEKIKEVTRKYLSNLTDVDVEVYDFDPDEGDPLFEKLNNIIQMHPFDIKELSKRSGIQPKYIEKIIETTKQKNIKSLPRLIETNVVGKTNIEKLYSFLTNSEIDHKNFCSTIQSPKLSSWQ
ncbi:MAG: Appr-1-p processing protein [Candidatus Altiarchaeales archaeon HGW-Altiarchaeales-2]|nr:MAG: Appr-1-p processing protein [Candidatus Altiarchaeales archaeon HGW-Altiarchaeales-2]